jgi:pimeloyl-ACP methyl ester carboxylesterase
MMAGASIPLVGAQGVAAAASAAKPTFVLVHGSWHGGWCWSRVLPLLEGAGARVSAPTLTGVGERAHLIDRRVNLETHVDDIVSHIDHEELTDVVLVGHSYAGFPASLAATRRPDAVSHLVLLDAFFPKEGETLLGHLGPDFANDFNARAAADLSWNIPPLPAEAFGLKGDDAAWVGKHLKPHPIATHTQAAKFGPGPLPRRSYIRCTESTIAGIFQTSLDNVRADGQFKMVDIAAGHDLMVDQPQLLAKTLLEVAA